MKGGGGLGARIIFGIGVEAYIVAVDHDEAPALVREIVVAVFEAHAFGDECFFVVGHGKIVVAQNVITRCLEFGENGADDIEALEIAVNEIAEMHDEGEVELVVLRDARGEFFWRLTVFADGAGLLAVLTIGQRAEAEERLGGLGDKGTEGKQQGQGGFHRGKLAAPQAKRHRFFSKVNYKLSSRMCCRSFV